MNSTARFQQYRLPNRFIVRFERWASYAGGASVLLLSALYLPHHADQADLVLGLSTAVVASLLFCIHGTLSNLPLAQRPLATWTCKISRGVSYLGYLIIGAMGAWFLPTFATGEARLVIGLLLILSAGLAVQCLGLCFALAPSKTT